MNAWRLAIVGLACLAAAAGCRTDPAITALERENRDLEDEIYELQNCLDRTQDELDRCRTGKAGTARGEAGPMRRLLEPPPPPPTEPSLPPAVRGPELSPLQGPPRPPVKAEELKVPQVAPPSQPLRRGERAKTLPGPGPEPPAEPKSPGRKNRFDDEEAPDLPPTPPVPGPKTPEPSEPKRLKRPGGSPGTAGRNRSTPESPIDSRVVSASAMAIEASADSARVRRITLDRELSGACDFDRRPGDDGLFVVVEPRDAQGRAIAAPAAIAVVLLDGALPGDEARFARWDLAADQVAGLYRRTPKGEGFCLELPWPDRPPAHSRLHLFVRYTTRDGRHLETDREIEVALPGQSSNGWSTVALREEQKPEVETDPAWRQKPEARQEARSQPSQSVEPAEPKARLASPPRPVWSPNRR